MVRAAVVIVAIVRLLSVASASVLAQLRLTRDELSRTRRHYAPSDTGIATLRTAHRLVGDRAALWRERIDRIEQVLEHSTERAPR